MWRRLGEMVVFYATRRQIASYFRRCLYDTVEGTYDYICPIYSNCNIVQEYYVIILSIGHLLFMLQKRKHCT